MTSVADGAWQSLRGFRTMPSISALFRPGLYYIPIRSEVRALTSAFETRFIETRNPDEIQQFVGMAGLHLLSVREFVPPSSLGDTGRECALHCVAGQGSMRRRRNPA